MSKNLPTLRQIVDALEAKSGLVLTLTQPFPKDCVIIANRLIIQFEHSNGHIRARFVDLDPRPDKRVKIDRLATYINELTKKGAG